MARIALPEHIEAHRDRHWNRDETSRVSTAPEAERFIERVGFASCLTDSRRPGPSLYVAVCGRRDAVMPRAVQHDPEASATWTLKDELIHRGKVYYAKLGRGRAMFIAPRLVPAFAALWGMKRSEEGTRLSPDARAILKVLRAEWEMATADLRKDAGISDTRRFTLALDELQAAMLVVPSEVAYVPKFTYIWTLAVGRFPDLLKRRLSREAARREIALTYLQGAGLTLRAELARVSGLKRPEAGLANRALVDEGLARMHGTGIYSLASLDIDF